jgi:GTPase SAR1 family protein
MTDKMTLLGDLLEVLKDSDKPKVIALVATRGVGKTYLLRHLIQHKNLPTILVDKNFQGDWDGISVSIPDKKIESLTKWNRESGILRIKGEKIVQRLRTVFNDYNENDNNKNRIAVIMEDCGEYTQTLGETTQLKGLCAAVRHANAHIFLVMHDLVSIHQRLKPELDALVLFRSNDEEDYFSRRRRWRKESEISEAFDKLNHHSSPKHQHYVIRFD